MRGDMRTVPRIKPKAVREHPALLFRWNTDHWSIPNALFRDANGRYFLGEAIGEKLEITREVTIAQALKWYAETSKYAEGSLGSIAQLCADAATIKFRTLGNLD